MSRRRSSPLQLMRNLHVSWASDGSGTLLTHRGEDTAFSTDLNRIAEGVEQVLLGQGPLAWV